MCEARWGFPKAELGESCESWSGSLWSAGVKYGHCLLEKLGKKETCGGQSRACPEAVRVHNWKWGCLCCLLAFPLNISCLEVSFSFFLPDVHSSHLSGLDPLFTRFLFFFDIEKKYCVISLRLYFQHFSSLQSQQKRPHPLLCQGRVVNDIFLKTHHSVM